MLVVHPESGPTKVLIPSKYYVNSLLFPYPVEYLVGLGEPGQTFTEQDKVTKVVNNFFCGEFVESVISA